MTGLPGATRPLDAKRTVNEVVHRIPESLAIFHEHGIDACCGGELAIEVACARHGVDAEALLERIVRLTDEGGGASEPDRT